MPISRLGYKKTFIANKNDKRDRRDAEISLFVSVIDGIDCLSLETFVDRKIFGYTGRNHSFFTESLKVEGNT